MSNATDARQLIARYIRARIPFISIHTDERQRALAILGEVSDNIARKFYCHSKSRGMYELVSGQVADSDNTYYGALDFIRKQMNRRKNLTFILTETGDISSETPDSQELYDLVQTAAETSSCIITITGKGVWPQLQRAGFVVTLDRPNEDEAGAIIKDLINPYRRSIPIEWDDEDIREAASTLSGITKIEIENTVSSLLASGKIAKDDLIEIRNSKNNLFSDISGLEKISLNGNEAETGGLAGLHKWCNEKKELLTPEKRDRLRSMGLRPPRGILLVGVPGCGKSLSAKAIASDWKLPLYRLDFATVQGSYVGQTEHQLRETFSMAEAVSPCVLWIDEIEKGLSGASSINGDVSKRMVGQFLFWLQECTKMVFVVATANDVSQLPPELLRRGRFDEIFFVDLPTSNERREILQLYMQRYLQLNFDGNLADELVQLTEGFSGADLESTVRDLAYKKVSNPEMVLTPDLFRKAFNNVIPLSQTSPEKIENIQARGRSRAVPASGHPIGNKKLRHNTAPRAREVLL